jgi:hypothetical protein
MRPKRRHDCFRAMRVASAVGHSRSKSVRLQNPKVGLATLAALKGG